MSERRQAFVREPIEIALSENTVISVGPIPWQQRNEFGNEIIQQNVRVVNKAVASYINEDLGIPQIEAKFSEKWDDPITLLKLGLDETLFVMLDIPKLHHNQIAMILSAACEVNGLEQLLPLVDPNLTTPTMLGGLASGLTEILEADTQRIESGLDSSLMDSPETPSEPSPIPNSESSSTNSTANSGTSGDGV